MTLNFILIAIAGFFLGVSMAAPPGPVMTMIMNRALVSVKSGFWVGMGAMTADLILLAIVYELNASINLTLVEPFIFLLGGFYFIYLGIKIFRSINEDEKGIVEEEKLHYSFSKGLTTGLVNPMQIGWWLTAGLSVIESNGLTTFYFFYAGIIAYVVLISFMINKSYLKFGEMLKYGVSVFSLFVLTGFGIYFIYSFILIAG